MEVLLVENEAKPRQLLHRFLEHAQYGVDVAATFAEAAAYLAGRAYDFVLLAQALPDGDGLELIRLATRHELHPTSCIVFTATPDVEHRLRGFALGADECLARPVSLAELERRMRVIIRQRVGLKRPAIHFGPGFVLDLAARKLCHGPHNVHLSRKQFDVLHHLLLHRGKVLTREQLGAHIGRRRTASLESSNFIDVHIMNVRRALAPFAPTDFLETVNGVGYRAA
ncbi:response regulator transcription factor [Hymenobacter sp. M29]|uniref:Response regulator transcription factor n=1 Tax=Hymenobacter mellowenesis TaxID=3063995 RepID=A0ABT9ABY1_9BACT|nr:response regulator transcription factor [Hymenobacter sp. M29]MDO7847053.1 response regulator transcription factor [Hymenobacter sp. M29]